MVTQQSGAVMGSPHLTIDRKRIFSDSTMQTISIIKKKGESVAIARFPLSHPAFLF